MATEFLRARVTFVPSCLGQVRRELWVWDIHYLLLLYLFPSRGISIAYEEGQCLLGTLGEFILFRQLQPQKRCFLNNISKTKTLLWSLP